MPSAALAAVRQTGRHAPPRFTRVSVHGIIRHRAKRWPGAVATVEFIYVSNASTGAASYDGERLMSERQHEYRARLIWEGNRGEGTATYTSYDREYRVLVQGKPDLLGTSDPMFRGDPAKHNPEDLFLTSVSACHMLFYLSLSAKHGMRVLSYEDEVRGTMVLDGGGGGRFEEITLHPSVTIADEKGTELAVQLHDRAHELCFIANSCNVPIHHRPAVAVHAA